MADEVKVKENSFLSVLLVASGWLAMLIFACHACTRMVGAGDTWVAMACGRHFLNHGVDTVEPFSANSHKAGPTEREIRSWPKSARWIAERVGLRVVKYWHPTGWVNQNWLTHVIFYWLTHKSPFADAETRSFNTLVWWKFTVYILIAVCVYCIGRLLGVNAALSAAFTCFALFIGRTFFDIRPAGFSNLMVAVFFLILVLTTYRNILYIWLIVPLSVLWCNLHGGYIYLFIMLAAFTVLNFLTSISKKRFVSIGLKGVKHTVAAGFVAFLAVVIFNPFHLTNLTHTFVISVSEHARMWRTVNEWHPAFEWSNPVGTGFPFLVLFILSIGSTLFWLFSHFLLPRQLEAPKNELQSQKRLFVILSKIFGCAAAVFVCWVTFISFSFVYADAASFLICAVFVGILLLAIYKSVHFIYLEVILTLVVLWLADAKSGYNGRYIFAFCLLPAYVILHIFVSLFSKTVKVKLKNIIFAALTAVLALLLMAVIINPFKFELPSWKEAALARIGQAFEPFLHIQRIWHPVYENNLTLTYRHLFGILYIINIASVIVWLMLPYLRRVFRQLSADEIGQQEPAGSYQLPKIDLALMVIAALTIYMAIKSRRFIPVAAIAACPIIAMFIDQMAQAISAARNFHNAGRKRNSLTVPAMPYGLRLFFTLVAVVIVLPLGTGWYIKFKRVYLDPWPTDAKLSSVFMRMTASDAKPFYAGEFIKINKLKGKMFNYWTEGGFIAWSQQPDSDTGRTPLQLFIDGRAQAAYEPAAYELWSNIMSGGPDVQGARIRRQALTTEHYIKIGQWINKRLKGEQAWLVLMPAGQFNTPFVKGLEHNSDWQLVFLNDKQKMFVDITTPQGKELYEGMFNGKTLYPDDFSRSVVIAHNMILFGRGIDEKKRGLELAIRAFSLTPSQEPMKKIIFAARFSELRALVNDFCKKYFDAFLENKDIWIKQDGYFHRIAAAMNAGIHLQAIARNRKNTELANFYAAKIEEFDNERKELLKGKRW